MQPVRWKIGYFLLYQDLQEITILIITGTSILLDFWETGDIFFSYEGYNGVPSYYYTEILEDSAVITLSYSNLHAIDSKFPEVSILIKNLLLRYQQEEYKRQNLISLSSEERYQLLRTSKPGLFKKVPIRMIASYLNLTRETLTRLMGKRS
ncbi:Crp/Fnr family transcriptional regulator [Mucilaginibacter sp. E4BP6]|uniref:Crp/Fnr family transcriptional regulator n=1 Tax=Mucilaginibacter sp. E4BP6 TaxID=2723089 RepID=UPI0015CB4E7B|nr:Crp/Fnr family transcriptional regulator [Mucilaginibacter sp. E4BP6]NYE64922.1 CRP-like cAMP-binding protein [Mucilaginibacter sp. E4BP6]